MRDKKCPIIKKNTSSITTRLSIEMDLNMIKAVKDLNLTSNLQYLLKLMETLFRKALNLELVFRLGMAAGNMKWLIRCLVVTNIGRFMTMFIMSRDYPTT